MRGAVVSCRLVTADIGLLATALPTLLPIAYKKALPLVCPHYFRLLWTHVRVPQVKG